MCASSKRHALTAYALLVVAYLMLPIAVVILFSFNDPAGRFNYVWQRFTFDNWVEWDAVLGLGTRSSPRSSWGCWRPSLPRSSGR